MRRDERCRARIAGRAQAWLLGVAVAIAAMFLGVRAEAQSVDVASATVSRPAPAAGAPSRASGTQDYISYADCKANVAITFVFTVTGDPSGGQDLQVWGTSSGADCSQGIADGCVLLQPQGMPSSGQLTLGAQQLVTQVLGLDGCDALPGTVPVATGTGGGGAGGAAPATETTDTDPVPIDLYFVLSDVGASQEWQGIAIDLWGPPAPAFTLGAGDQYAIVTLAPGAADPNTLGYQVLCAPAGAPQPDAGAGASSGMGGAGGTGGGGGAAAGDACPQGVDLPVPANEQHPDITSPSLKPYLCGNVPNGPGAMSVVPDLRDETDYVVALVGYDEVNNFGPVSALECVTPESVGTFIKVYCEDGGAACPGCGIGAVGSGGDLAWAALASSLLIAVSRARRRCPRRRAGPWP